MAPRETDPAPAALLALVEDAEGDEVVEEAVPVLEALLDVSVEVEAADCEAEADPEADEVELESEPESVPWPLRKQAMSSCLRVVEGVRAWTPKPTQIWISGMVVLQYS